MKNKTKRFLIFIASVILLFGIYNLIWYLLIHSKYDPYTEGMDEFRKNISYILNEEDGYLYNVKLPDYISYTGNLGISTRNNEYSLLIWPNVFTDEVEYGVQIQAENNEVWSIMVDENMEAVNAYYDEIVNENREAIEDLYKKAREKWSF